MDDKKIQEILTRFAGVWSDASGEKTELVLLGDRVAVKMFGMKEHEHIVMLGEDMRRHDDCCEKIIKIIVQNFF